MERVLDATTLPCLLLGGDPRATRRRPTPSGVAPSATRPPPAWSSVAPCSSAGRRRRVGRRRRPSTSCTEVPDEPARQWLTTRSTCPRSGSAADGGSGRRDPAATTPRDGSTPGCASRRSCPGGSSSTTAATRRPSWCRSWVPGGSRWMEADGTTHTADLPGARVGLRRPDRRRLRRSRCSSAGHLHPDPIPVGWRCAAPRRPARSTPGPTGT
jgi:hypothetical protein